MRLLLVEDETDLAGALRVGLTRAGHAVDLAADATEAYELLLVNAYDLMLLDVNLPDVDGFTVCRTIRRGEVEVAAGRDLRVLMLTARGALGDRVRGLDEGADDYLVKPFALAELLARVRALLRRDTAGTGAVLTVGDLSLDAARHEAQRAGRPLRLTPKEFGVLEYLMTRPGRVVPAEELLEHVWDANADPFTETVRVTVGTLRRKLTGGDGDPPIETVIGRGYRLREAV
ncbi:DNA-binding response regulator, OmpR family, contains REC and winged-helix (wHTH) domain [Micromonospora pallida]|uniref:DNA-binding response regulator, OmpR family, contains REC and winged-helix (WHTH) domain n=1 Tax=Micromonospora pallida TaxID=145854 RepID=A0A1C6RVE6_9ACTN|nr:response regulator transcription factor [Micromonospora pallida]SCL20990.1 DNA-binding response regulator, OmpR family, contains REC and winged-helix (wHTH) domain [Micromonospora pallida]